MPEIIIHEESGLMYDRHDTGALADCMERVLTDPNLRLRLASVGLERVRTIFSMDATMAAIEKVFDDAVQNRPFQ
jgi:glycosyltransferase involved in cell wall biosynthesis